MIVAATLTRSGYLQQLACLKALAENNKAAARLLASPLAKFLK